ncbi:MAG: S-methyl-5-thioribose-1-phosphate isomerase [Planctomycetes bacterium]|nr:S-methyl-5-thioribose-1-phosphate isomerase [Planctomycetota bacterium]
MPSPRNIEWIGPAATGHLRLLDQTRLPNEVVYLDCRDVAALWSAIRRLVVRGAPAIGVAAAYGCVLGAQRNEFDRAADYLATSRPTAVNLFWAIDRMRRVQPCTPQALLDEAVKIHEEDAAMCVAIGKHALPLLQRRAGASPAPRPIGVLTHCNAGALATGGIGTATAPMYLAHEQGVRLAVFADETRPLLQGARLTAFELQAAGIDVTLICDNMAGQVLREGRIDLVITGADRIAANGDAANKIGTYALAVVAKHHGVPFYVAAPSSTFDMAIPEGSHIPIEQRAAEEITEGFGTRTAPQGVKTYSPAFDVTPHGLITAIITEKGVIQPVDAARVKAVLG